MNKFRIPTVCFMIIMLVLMSMPSLAFGASANVHLSDSTGVQLDWEYKETPPKRPKPMLLNSANYETKWKIDNSLLVDIVQDQNGIIYTTDADDIVQAIYPNGKVKWSIQLDMGFENPVIYLKLGQDGTIYAHSSNLLGDPRLTSIYALSPEGKVQWNLSPTSTIISQFDDHFAGDAQGNLVYFTNQGLVSRNAKGDINWIDEDITSSDYLDGLHISNLFTDPQSNIYVDSANKEIISLDSLGNVRWTSAPQNYLDPYNTFHPYFSDAGFLYMLTVSGLHALNAEDGSTVTMTRDSDIADIRSSGIPTDGKGGYYIIPRGIVQKVDYAGDIISEYDERATENYGVDFDSLVTDSRGNAYFNTGSGNIIGLNPDGQEIFAFLRNAFWHKITKIVIGKNGNIYSSNHDIGLVAFGPKQIQVYKDNLSLPLSVAPIKDGGTVLVPFRSLFEGFGLAVGWDPASQTITGTREGLNIQMAMGSKTAYVNGQAKQLTVAPQSVNNSTYIPLRFVGESLGMNVSWDAKSSSVNIDSKG
ncbi:stalk domain-containing protein [Paenibacillus kobensis]|uniref:stalk domain-containing protein n=1 Tax=Paenibacillus kobensis TaxID=59841 RepID=UPI000FDBC992|nr:stalk domain-containing protein [Paenibacillus kobensis]